MNQIGANVLVIGSGPSGMDIVLQLSKMANRVTWSRKQADKPGERERKEYGNNVSLKTTVRLLTTNGAEFMDGTHETFTAVIYATGELIKIIVHISFHD